MGPPLNIKSKKQALIRDPAEIVIEIIRGGKVVCYNRRLRTAVMVRVLPGQQTLRDDYTYLMR